MKFRSIALVFGLLLFGCKQKEDKAMTGIKEKETLKGTITLIFNNAPESYFRPYSKSDPLGGRRYFENMASYNDPEGIRHVIDSKRTPFIDTVNVSIESLRSEIYFERNGLEGVSYLFRNGDIVQINYDNGNPEIEILNRPTKAYDYKFNMAMAKDADSIGLSPFEKFFRVVPFPQSTRPLSQEEFTKFFREELQKNSILLLTSLREQKHLLDSLYRNDFLSEETYRYHDKKLTYIDWGRLARIDNLANTKPALQIARSNDSPERNGYRSEIPQGDHLNLEAIIKSGDSLLGYRFYQEFISDHFMPNLWKTSPQKNHFRMVILEVAIIAGTLFSIRSGTVLYSLKG